MSYPYSWGNGYKCAVCGAWVPNGTIHSCGGSMPWRYPQPVQPPAVTWNVTGWKCPSCGAGVAPFMPYCPHCAPTKDEPAEETAE